MNPRHLRIFDVDGARAGEIPSNPEEFLRHLGGPTLLRWHGRDPSRTRAVATLLHGNEPSGLLAVHGRLRAGLTPAVDTLVFIGAVEAALHAPVFTRRVAPGADDLNRCFREPFAGTHGLLARELLQILRSVGPEALIDLHNNTGRSPIYGVSPRMADAELDLVSHFADRCLHFDIELGGLVEATRNDFPSVVIECGLAGDPVADRAAREGLDRYLDAPRLEAHGPVTDVLVDPVRVRVRAGTRLAIGSQRDPGADLTLREDADCHNFQRLETGASIGWVRPDGEWPLSAMGADGSDVSRELFEIRAGELFPARPLVPIMITNDLYAASTDCLFYVARPLVVTPAESRAEDLAPRP